LLRALPTVTRVRFLEQMRPGDVALVFAQIANKATAGLKRWDVRIEIHPVDGFQLEGHVMREDLRDVFTDHDGEAPGERSPGD
jgi:hypothetical protein